MGICCSKTNPKFSSPTPKLDPQIEKNPNPNHKIDKNPGENSKIKEIPIKEDAKSIEEIEKKEQNLIPGDTVLVTEISSDSDTKNSNFLNNGNAIVRTSSCTRDEVEEILIQCGRLSRSSSAVQTPVRKYSGSKRSFDFDQETDGADVARRRTPSRERERRERRVSRSPGKRHESPSTTCHNAIGSGGVSRPGKMVSVPRMAMDKSGNGDEKIVTAVKKVVSNNNRKVVVSNASPRRSRSPAARGNVRVSNDSNQNLRVGNDNNQNLVLSRSNSRKGGEHSPYRRNPLREIDQNSQKKGVENVKNSRTKAKEQPQSDENAIKAPQQIINNVAVNVVVASEPIHKPQALTRTRSSRLSRDLENLNLEPQNTSPTTSYTALLLEDIQNFHNKTPITESSLQQSISKACSIVGEIADLNSNNGKFFESKEPPLVETEVVAMTDLIEPSFQKYVTVKRGNAGRREEEEESSGSNSFGGPQHWISSSLWETNSNESTDCWASSSRSNTRDDDRKKRGNKSSPAITTVTI